MKIATLLLATSCLAIVGAGCNDAGPQKLDENYMKNGAQIGAERREIMLRTSGDFDSMAAADKKKFLDSFNGNEAEARKNWDMMKNPPTSTLPQSAGTGGTKPSGAATGSTTA
ncbi:MAG: hypothetical protein ACAH95_03335 [Fimbriimonas sp.]